MIVQSYPTAKPLPSRHSGGGGQAGWGYLAQKAKHITIIKAARSKWNLQSVANRRIDSAALTCFSIQKVVVSVGGWGCS